jgi:hypothetical protein
MPREAAVAVAAGECTPAALAHLEPIAADSRTPAPPPADSLRESLIAGHTRPLRHLARIPQPQMPHPHTHTVALKVQLVYGGGRKALVFQLPLVRSA